MSQKARDNEFTTNKEDHPLIVQFAANDAHYFSSSAELVSQYCNGVDLNCGKARDNEFTTNKEDKPLIVQFAANDAHYFSSSAELMCVIG